jgi:hypothetical protein
MDPPYSLRVSTLDRSDDQERDNYDRNNREDASQHLPAGEWWPSFFWIRWREREGHGSHQSAVWVIVSGRL